MLAWHVAQTEAFKGRIAEEEVRNLGFEVFNPKIRNEHKNRRGLVRKTEAHYIPGYLFARFDVEEDHWERINTRRGIKQLMRMSSEKPATISDEALAPLLGICCEGYVIEAKADELIEFELEQTVKIQEGAFAGFPGIITAIDKKMLFLHVMIFGRPTSTSVHRRAVSLATDV